MSSHDLAEVIAAADRAIVAEDFDTLMGFYAEDAVLVVRPGKIVQGKDAIRTASIAIAQHFGHNLDVRQGDMMVLKGGDTALVLSKTFVEDKGKSETQVRRATYVFQKSTDGRWLCVIDNSYGTSLLDAR